MLMTLVVYNPILAMIANRSHFKGVWRAVMMHYCCKLASLAIGWGDQGCCCAPLILNPAVSGLSAVFAVLPGCKQFLVTNHLHISGHSNY